MTQKRKRGPSKRKPKQRPSRNYWDKDGNLAQIIDPEDPQALKGGGYWAEILARIVATCDEQSPDWRDKG